MFLLVDGCVKRFFRVYLIYSLVIMIINNKFRTHLSCVNVHFLFGGRNAALIFHSHHVSLVSFMIYLQFEDTRVHQVLLPPLIKQTRAITQQWPRVILYLLVSSFWLLNLRFRAVLLTAFKLILCLPPFECIWCSTYLHPWSFRLRCY